MSHRKFSDVRREFTCDGGHALVVAAKGASVPRTATITPGIGLNPFTAKLFNLNFHPLEIVSR